jgi:threonine/homoserine/homoserine lactone efflux protein
MYDLNHWIVFFTAAFALNISPGPDIAYIVSNTVAQGKRHGFAASWGVCSGAIVHVMAAAFGLSAILAASALAFSVVKWVGAAYLIYLGIHALMTAGAGFSIDGKPRKDRSTFAIYRQGFMIDVLNPKVAVFFMAFLPQFSDPTMGHVPLQLVLHGALVIAVGVLVEAVIVLIAARFTEALRRNPRIGLWLDRALGTVLIGLGVRLALQQRGAH